MKILDRIRLALSSEQDLTKALDVIKTKEPNLAGYNKGWGLSDYAKKDGKIPFATYRDMLLDPVVCFARDFAYFPIAGDTPHVEISSGDKDIDACVEAHFGRIWNEYLSWAMVGAIDYGYAVAGLAWRQEDMEYDLTDDYGKISETKVLHGAYKIGYFEDYDPEFVEYESKKGIITKLSVDYGLMDSTELEPYLFQWAANEERYGNYYGRGRLDLIYDAWYRANTIRAMACIALERQGMNPLIGYYPLTQVASSTDSSSIDDAATKQYNEDEQDKMLDTADEIQTTGASAAFPSVPETLVNEKGQKVPTGKNAYRVEQAYSTLASVQPFMDMAALYDRQVLLGYWHPDSSITKTDFGTRAEGEQKNSSDLMGIHNRLIDVAYGAANGTNYQKGMVYYFVKLNFGADAPVPKLAPRGSDVEKVALQNEVLKAALAAANARGDDVIGGQRVMYEMLADAAGIPLQVIEESEEPEPAPIALGLAEDYKTAKLAAGSKITEKEIKLGDQTYMALVPEQGGILVEQADRVANMIYKAASGKPEPNKLKIDVNNIPLMSKVEAIFKDFLTQSYEIGFDAVSDLAEDKLKMVRSPEYVNLVKAQTQDWRNNLANRIDSIVNDAVLRYYKPPKNYDTTAIVAEIKAGLAKWRETMLRKEIDDKGFKVFSKGRNAALSKVQGL